jgi:hypothetical protein
VVGVDSAQVGDRSNRRRRLVPEVVSPRHAFQAFVVGFMLEAGTEVYQLATGLGWWSATSLGYYTGLATSALGFYFFWRGFHEWNRLPRSSLRIRRTTIPWGLVSMLAGGIVATGLLSVAQGSVGAGDSPPPLAWTVGGVMVVAYGSFFYSLRRMVAPYQAGAGRVVGWAAFAWSLVIATIAGLVLGERIVGLFVDFFTNWTALLVALMPFVTANAPLFVAFLLLTIALLDGGSRSDEKDSLPNPGAHGV